MEKMFGVRYWDYSNQPLNLMGHICLFVSLGWGVFSVLLVRIVHRPIEGIVYMLPDTITDIIAFVLTIAMAVDFTQSFNEAMDLKAAIEKLAKRLEVASAFVEDDYNKMKEKFAEGKASVMNKAGSVGKLKGRISFENDMNERKGVKLATLQRMTEAVKESLKNKIMDEKAANQLLETLENEKVNLKADTGRNYKSVFRIMKRNPGAISRKHEEELNEIKRMIK